MSDIIDRKSDVTTFATFEHRLADAIAKVQTQTDFLAYFSNRLGANPTIDPLDEKPSDVSAVSMLTRLRDSLFRLESAVTKLEECVQALSDLEGIPHEASTSASITPRFSR
jgi:hypothetical protein